MLEIEMEPEVREWLDTLTDPELTRVATIVERLHNEGVMLGMPRAKPLGDGLRELRFDLGNKAVRITYWIRDDTAVLLTVFRKTRDNEHRQVERARQAMKVCDAQCEGDPEHTYTRRPLEED
ncbi:type II toxin-antitoxin system RelE/ParE family toxin [Embleya sp. NPDC050493]|uniref:type II toxin-antitoxin system RelE/ParE family toxin n=1 Tax=Embleya sp. NPDC050493 TaxID=3363989 RepID=UPI0037B8B6C8